MRSTVKSFFPFLSQPNNVVTVQNSKFTTHHEKFVRAAHATNFVRASNCRIVRPHALHGRNNELSHKSSKTYLQILEYVNQT